MIDIRGTHHHARFRSESYEPRRTELADWTAAWTEEIAKAVGGLDQGQRWDVASILREVRRRAAADDLSPPMSLPHAQGYLPLWPPLKLETQA